MSVYNRQNQEFVPLAETSGILQNMTSSNIEYVVCADGETPEYNTGIRLSPSKKLKFSQNVGVSYVRVVGNTTGDIIVTPNDEASSGGGSTTRIINHVQDWQPDTLYPTGTLVIYNNVLYKCVVPNHKTIFDPADWVVIGAGNDSGKGISVWNSQTNYKVDDIILHGNTLYVCVNEHVSSTEFGDDTEYWVVITDNAGTVLPDWQAREKYEKDEIVNVGGFIYRCKSPHISRDTFATMNDVVGDEDYWELISWVDWHTETQYLKDQIVYHDGALWRCLTNHVSDNTSISNDSDKWIKICGYTLPVASVSGLGGIKVGNGLTITDDGTLSTNAIEVVKVNNEPLPLDDKSVNIDLTDYVRSNDITAVLHYKGTKQDYNDLPIAGNIIGDVWNIVNSDTTHSVKAGDNVAWNGSTWDVLSGTVDLSGYVIKEIGKGLSTEDFTSVLKAKLEGIETGANAYTLPIATENILGGVKVGSGLSISNDGILSVEFAPNNDIVTWVAGTAYNVGQYVIYNNNLYECKTANNDASFDETKWQLIGASGGNFQITDWESGETYAVGDLVIYNDVLYQCTTANSDVSFDSDKWTSIGEPERDLQQWESGKSYRVGHFVIKDNKLYQCTTANSDTTFDATKWTEIGDMSDIQAWESGTSYSANDYVIYDNRVYKCTTANSDTTFTASNWQDMGSIQSYITEWHSGKAYTVGTLVIKDKAIYKCTTANSDLTFTPSKWEKQIDSDKSLTAWVSGTSYKAGQYVVYQGKIYECTTANNDVAFDDTKWSLINEATGLIVDSWKTKTVYKKNQIIEYIGDMYMCLVGHTSDSFKEDYDSEHWLKVDHSIPFYQDNTFYPKDSVVSYEGKLLRCLVSHSSSSDSPFNADFFSKSWASQDSDNVLCYSTSRDSTMARMNTPKSINLDLGNEFTSSSIRITIKHYTARVHFNDISVYVSNDNTNFESVGTAQISGYVNKTYNFAFLEKTFRYIRIGASGATPWNTNIFGSYSGWTIVSKVEVFQDNSNKWEILAGEEYNLPIATENILGGVKVGSNITINANGTISLTRDNITNALGYTPPEQDTDTTYPAVTYLENGLMLADDKKMLDYIVNTYWKPSTAYAVGATANHYALPPSYYLECTTPGTTGATAPVITSVTAGDTITDGSVVWTVRQCLPTSGGTMTGDIATNSGIVFSDFTKILDIGTTPNTAPLIVLSNPKVRLIGGNRESVNAGKCLIMAGKPGNTFNPYLGISPDGSAFYSPVGASAQEYDLGGSAIVAKSLGTYGGYIKRASGEILQFGYNSVNGAGAGNINSKEITFPISFSTAPIVVANVQTSYPNDINSSADKINASKFSFYLSGGTLNYGYGVLWFAIGI